MFANVALGALAAIILASAQNTIGSGALTYIVPLTSQAMTEGDMDGSGQAKLTIDPDRKHICYEFKLSGVATPLMAHIHKGLPADSGPSVVTLFTGPGAELNDCLLWTEKWLAAIAADPSGFYVNIYTTEFPGGALRGQLLG